MHQEDTFHGMSDVSASSDLLSLAFQLLYSMVDGIETLHNVKRMKRLLNASHGPVLYSMNLSFNTSVLGV